MKKNFGKREGKGICSWLLIAAMAVQTTFANTAVAYADSVSMNGVSSNSIFSNNVSVNTVLTNDMVSKRTQIVSSDLSVPQSWTLDISDSTVTAVLTDTRTDEALNAMLMLLEKEETDYNKYLNRVSGRLNNNTCSMSLDLSTVTPGTYKLILWKKMTNSTYSGILGFYLIEVTEDGCYFADSVLGESEENFLEEATANFEPEKYATVPYIYYDSVSNLTEIIETAKEVTALCNSDEEKVSAIQDWICERISYDTEGVANGTSLESGNPEWVFENLKANCTGFSELFQIMTTAVGVPCILVGGYASSSCLFNTKDTYTSMNHEWTLVYVNSSWHIVDITWNNQNEYVGADSENNRSSNLGNFGYTGIAPKDFGLTHFSKKVFATPGVSNLEFTKEPATTEFYQGDGFVFDGAIQVVDLTGEKYDINTSHENVKIEGYDLSKTGTQTVKISYADLTLEYQITVKPPKAEENEISKIEFATEPVTTVFEQGEEFVFDGSICYVNTNNESHPISMEDENLSISGYDMNTVGTQTVTVSYYDFELLYEITVNETDVSGVVISAQSVNAKRGSEIAVPITITNNSGIMGLGLDVSYAANVFEKPTITKGEVLADGIFNDSITDATNGSFKVMWSATENVVTDGELFTIHFVVKQDAQLGDYAIKIKNCIGDTFDETYSDIEVKCLSANVIVKELTEEGSDNNTSTGETPTGGSSSTGGSTSTGGSSSAGGSTSTGGSGSTGGSTSTGGSGSTSGSSSTGGSNSSGENASKPSTPIIYPQRTGTKLSDGKASYKVTSGSLYRPTVEYVAPMNKKASNVTIPNYIKIDGVTYYVTAIAPNAFKNNKKIKNVTIGYNVEQIGKKAFYKCTSLKKVDLGLGLEVIGSSAFYGCKALKNIELGWVKTIGDSAFYGCKKLKMITFYEIKTIGKKAFYNCKQLNDITIASDKLKSVGSKAFYNIYKKAQFSMHEKKVKKYKKLLKKACKNTPKILGY